ncbi:MAG: histidinol dehydrogenase [Actinomycetota bacterium]
MLTRVDLRGRADDPSAYLPRAALDREAARAVVREIVAGVRAGGDAAALAFQERFGVRPASVRVPAERIQSALEECDPELREAIESAAARIRAYHERQAAEERTPFWRIGAEGAWVGEESRPVERAGCYVPGGRAAYPSTVLMTALPARIAGVRSIAVCVPPAPGGEVHPATLVACAVAKVDEVYALGGAQAVAAMAYGTESIARADVIVGPGNLWVTLAKHEVCMDVGVDSFAGPTEVAIVADDSASAVFVAADLVAQAEHDPLATAILITDCESLADAVDDALKGECARASRRDDVEAALRGQGRALIVEDIARAMEVANAFAPEHLELIVRDAESWLPSVRDAGAVFVGAYTPVALGDYVAGTNHVLPTAGSARFASPLRVSNFVKSTAVVLFDRAGLDDVAPALLAIARAEGLDAHARALSVRLEDGA